MDNNLTNTPPHVAVVILNFNGWADTLACVSSLLQEQTICKLSIIVADNASKDRSYEHLRHDFKCMAEIASPLLCLDRPQALSGHAASPPSSASSTQIVLIQNGANLGFAAGCNSGVQWAMAAQADFVWLLNNDTEVAPLAIQALLDRFKQIDKLGLCGSKLIYHDQRNKIQARGGATFDPRQGIGQHIGVGEDVQSPEDMADIECHMDYVVGASMMASRAFIERVGLMTEDYLLYYEELDWATRGVAQGFKLGYAADSVVFHKEGATIGTSHRTNGSSLSMRFLSRNRLLFVGRFHRAHLWSVRRRMAFECLVWLKRQEFAHAWALMRALLGFSVKLPS